MCIIVYYYALVLDSISYQVIHNITVLCPSYLILCIMIIMELYHLTIVLHIIYSPTEPNMDRSAVLKLNYIILHCMQPSYQLNTESQCLIHCIYKIAGRFHRVTIILYNYYYYWSLMQSLSFLYTEHAEPKKKYIYIYIYILKLHLGLSLTCFLFCLLFYFAILKNLPYYSP